MAAIESASSWAPQANDQPPPPMAQAPKPTAVIRIPVVPSCRVGSNACTEMDFLPTQYSCAARLYRPRLRAVLWPPTTCQCRQGLEGVAGLLFRQAQLVELLQSHPEFGAGPKEIAVLIIQTFWSKCDERSRTKAQSG